jgi:hypothetical protein
MENDPDTRRHTFSAAGDGCLNPALLAGLTQRQRLDALRAMFDHIDALAVAASVISATVRVSPLAADFNVYLPDFLAATTRAGYVDRSLCSQVIDLCQASELILSGMTKGHRSDVRKGRTRMDVDVLDRSSMTHGDFAAYQEMHAKAAGRVTRPRKTFDLMEKWVAEGESALVRACLDGVDAGFAFILVDRGAAYYASAANNPDVHNEPVGHVIQAAAIDWLKRRGIDRYELGQQVFGPLPYLEPSLKELAIARFKRGFGGALAPLVIRHKTYS